MVNETTSDSRAALNDLPNANDRETVLDARGLVRTYRRGQFDVPVLKGLDLQVERGEWVACTGRSGSGKSTLLNVLGLLDSADGGRYLLAGQDVSELDDAGRAGMRNQLLGFVFQLHNLLPQLTAVGNVEIAMFGTSLPRAQRRQRALRLLADVDLGGRESRQPTRLSGGERQRVAIARALANDPPLLLADEPTGNLDSASVELVIGLIERLRHARPELTVVMVTHDPQVAAAADRVVHMRDGRIVPGPVSSVGRTS